MLNRNFLIILSRIGVQLFLIHQNVYRIFKCNHNIEKYLLELPNDLRKAFCHFRCMNHHLPIEQGRFWGVLRDDRICDLCDRNNLGDEYHYIFDCTFFKTERKKYLSPKYTVNHNIEKFYELFNSDYVDNLCKLAKFCKIILAVTR